MTHVHSWPLILALGTLGAVPLPLPPSLQWQPVLAQAADPTIPPLPNDVPAPQPPDPQGIVGRSPSAEINIGIGYLRPENLDFLNQPDWPNSPHLGANWLQAIALPIYAEPGDTPWGWLINGWLLVEGYDPILVGQDASFLMLQTHYALLSFPVLEVRDDGWFRFQYTPAGTAWAHQDHLELGEMALTLETWPEHFLATGWVEFWRHGISQPLRTNPSAGILTLVGPDSFIEPLAFEGDWMRVRITQPTDGCTFLPGYRSQEGWMRWRSEQVLIWHPPRGC
ncbi:MAG: hypothetical protein ACFB0C_16305 [Leptolyngbyaceae cyanobacterium]